jgi:probable HAF family extracellular repeat protein
MQFCIGYERGKHHEYGSDQFSLDDIGNDFQLCQCQHGGRRHTPQSTGYTMHTLTDLGTLGGSISIATDINEAGQIVGCAYTAGGQRTFLWKNGVMTDLGTLGGNYSTPRAINRDINEAGQIVGQAQTADGQYHAFLWDEGTLTDLGTLGGNISWPNDINEAGQIVGQAQTASGQFHAFLWKNGVMTDLGTLGGTYSAAIAINEAGQIAGASYTAGGQTHAVLWDNGKMTDLGTFGGSNSYPNGMNDVGQIAGQAQTVDGHYHAFLWDGETLTDLGTLGGSYSAAFAINKAGQIVGQTQTASGQYRAFLWDGGMLSDLGTLGGSWSIAIAINEAGKIVGQAETASRQLHPVFWDGRTLTDLGTLGGRTGHATAINEAGQIVGQAQTAGGQEHAFLAMTMAVNAPPTANAGGLYQGVKGMAIAMSSATASDPDASDTLTYSWSVDSALCTFDDTSLLNPNLTCSGIGSFTATLEVRDGVNPPVTSAASVTVIFNFTGFFQPVDNLPTLNSVKAGQAIPLKFSLGGDQGLNIFAAGYPKSELITCGSSALVDGIEETATAGSSSLTYDAATDQYTYVWKTQKSWAGTCRQLVVKLSDGTTQRADFQFK